MPFTTKIIRVREYDNIPGHDDTTSFSWTTQEIGTGTDAGRNGMPVTASAVPGRLTGENDPDTPADDRTYVRTDITGFPAGIQTRMNACWTNDLHTAYEAYLRTL